MLLRFERTGSRGNNITLRCEDDLRIPIRNANFFVRAPDMQSVPDEDRDGVIMFTLTPETEGYFSCQDTSKRWSLVISFIVVLLPLFYIFFVTLHWMCSQRQFGQRMIGRVQGWIEESRKHVGTAGSEESLPDRLINPDEYEEDLTDPVGVQVKQ